MSPERVCILQAYEAPSVPRWIQCCLDSVRDWAAPHSYDYRFSTEFWRYVPDWFRERCGAETGPMTDVARLYMMREQFDRGAELVVWVDADVVVFDPDCLRVDTTAEFFGIEEVTVFATPDGKIHQSPRGVNGAVLGAHHRSTMFERYLTATESVVRDYPDAVLPRTLAGPVLLTKLAETHTIGCLKTVGLFTPAILRDIASGEARLPAAFARGFGHKVAAANLCHFYRGVLPGSSTAMYDAIMLKAIDVLMKTRGEAVNRHVPFS